MPAKRASCSKAGPACPASEALTVIFRAEKPPGLPGGLLPDGDVGGGERSPLRCDVSCVYRGSGRRRGAKSALPRGPVRISTAKRRCCASGRGCGKAARWRRRSGAAWRRARSWHRRAAGCARSCRERGGLSAAARLAARASDPVGALFCEFPDRGLDRGPVLLLLGGEPQPRLERGDARVAERGDVLLARLPALGFARRVGPRRLLRQRSLTDATRSRRRNEPDHGRPPCLERRQVEDQPAPIQVNFWS